MIIVMNTIKNYTQTINYSLGGAQYVESNQSLEKGKQSKAKILGCNVIEIEDDKISSFFIRDHIIGISSDYTLTRTNDIGKKQILQSYLNLEHYRIRILKKAHCKGGQHFQKKT